jgi:hypothetical protein
MEIETKSRTVNFPELPVALKDRDIVFAWADTYNHLRVEEFGFGKMVHKPTRINGWIVCDIENYHGTIHPKAQEILDQLRKDYPGLGFEVMLADDSQRQFLRAVKKIDDWCREAVKKTAKRVVTVMVAPFAISLALAVAVVLIPLVACAIGTVGLLYGASQAIGAFGIDPAVVIVLKDGTWIQLYEWWDEPSPSPSK